MVYRTWSGYISVSIEKIAKLGRVLMTEYKEPVQEVLLPENWTPGSWTEREATQQVNYPDQQILADALGQLSNLPPLVTSWEIIRLRKQIAEAQQGKWFILQGGDCSENFIECASPVITNRLKVLLQMSLI